MNHDAVFWDVGGVILNIESITRAQEAFVRALIDEYDLRMTDAEALAAWRDGMREHFAGRQGREYRTARDARRKAAEALFDGEPPADWRDRHTEVSNDIVELNPGVAETVRTLSEAGVYQAVVSDADEGLVDRIARFGLDEYFDDVTTSEEVGYVKPDRRMFETALEKARRAGVDPERGVMIGDKYENDMEGASRFGLTTVAYGADDGPAVDHRIDDVRELLPIVGVEER